MTDESDGSMDSHSTTASSDWDGDASPAFEHLSELLLYVEDMDVMASFYTDVFGLDIVEGQPEHGFVKFDTGACRLCLHAGSDGDIGADAPKFIFGVEDVDSTRAYLENRGVEVGPVRSPAPGKQVCDGLDPEGNAFSIESTDG